MCVRVCARVCLPICYARPDVSINLIVVTCHDASLLKFDDTMVD